MNKTTSAKFQLIVSMMIFGSIGIFRKYIPLPSSILALVRGGVGMLFLLIVVTLQKKTVSASAFKKNWIYLLLSGGFIGFNWILLFEAYNYTSVAVATLCYYMAPIIVILFSPLILKEKLSVQRWICILFAITGVVLVSGVLKSGVSAISEMKGIFLGLGAAALYAFVILLNKKIDNISPYDKTIYQLGIASIVLLPYTLVTEKISDIQLNTTTIALLLLVGIVHTGITYYLYFGSISVLNAQTSALYSYIDPIVAIMLSAFLLNESIGIFEITGTLFILGSTIICELFDKKQENISSVEKTIENF